MNLVAIVIATLCAGIGSVWIAGLLLRLGVRNSMGPRDAGPVGAQNLLSLAAGALLATAFMHLLPEAFESQVEPHTLFAILLVGLVFFFLLDKAELWHHGHEHHHGPGVPGHSHAHEHDHSHAHTHPPRGGGGWAVLTGDSVHCFGDGVMIASAFMADLRLGLVAALSVMAHEVPHHIGDLVVMGQAGSSRRVALIKVSLAGAVTLLGGLLGWWLVARLVDYLPYFLVMASSSFIYVALADLIPQLQRRLGAVATAVQVAWLLAGIGMVVGVSHMVHG